MKDRFSQRNSHADDRQSFGRTLWSIDVGILPLCLSLFFLFSLPLLGEDMDGDGLDDVWEAECGFTVGAFTAAVYLDGVNGDDGNSGLSPDCAKRTFAGALSVPRDSAKENVILVSPGVYAGPQNRGLDFQGDDIKIRSLMGAEETVVDLGESGRFLSLHRGETLASRVDGLTLCHGYAASEGTAISLSGASLEVRNCIFRDNRGGHRVCYENGDGSVQEYWQDGFSTAALFVEGGTGVISGCQFEDNESAPLGHGSGETAGNVGALNVSLGGTVAVSACVFRGNGGYDAGAVLLSGASASFDQCLFTGNLSRNGAALVLRSLWYLEEENWEYREVPSEVELSDCLFRDNATIPISSGSGALQSLPTECLVSSGSSLQAVHCTFLAGMAEERNLLRLEGQGEWRNCILDGSFSLGNAGLLEADFCCSPQSLTDYGTGNLQKDPLLTPAGFLTSLSPARDAGSADPSGSSRDLLGTLRPAGSAPDMGCHEFLDDDEDGIPDVLEGEEGVLPGEDEDGDGLSNLQEFLLGTDLGRADTDGDDIADGEEVEAGYSPLRPTRRIYVDGNLGDDAKDGSGQDDAVETISRGVALARQSMGEGVVLLAPGIYGGAANRGVDFQGMPIRILGQGGREGTIIDLEGAGPMLSLSHGESSFCSLEGVTLRNGYRDNGGIAIHLEGASLSLRDCGFEGNISGRRVVMDWGNGQQASYWEGGYESAPILARESRLTLVDCRFAENKVQGEISGSAVNAGALLLQSSQVRLEQCHFEGNQAVAAGAILQDGGETLLRQCVLRGNQGNVGNGIVVQGSSYSGNGEAPWMALENCLLDGRESQGSAPEVVLASGGQGTLLHCTLLGNPVSGASSLVAQGQGSLSLRNSIVTGLLPALSSGTLTAESSCLPQCLDFFPQAGNLFLPPKITGEGILLPDSPCLDAADPVLSSPVDLHGTPRPAGEAPDMGCDEYVDQDGDDISDTYERLHGGDLLPGEDNDQDGLTNREEYLLGTCADRFDTDGDGMPDGWETAQGLNPLEKDGEGDLDGDGLPNLDEFLHGCSAGMADSDGDGISDGRELLCGLDPANGEDGDQDLDGDGLTNREELLLYGTEMAHPDTDGDGVEDGTEVEFDMDPLFPALRSACGRYSYECTAVEWQEREGWLFFPADSLANQKLFLTLRSTTPFSLWVYFTDEEGREHSFCLVPGSPMGFSQGEEGLRFALGEHVTNGLWHPAAFEAAQVPGMASLPGAWLSLHPSQGLEIGQARLLKYVDRDGDMLPDEWEEALGLNPEAPEDAQGDMDGDGLSNWLEFLYETDGEAPDTDGDGLSDGWEVLILGTNPLSPDQDADELLDGWEITHFAGLHQNGMGDQDGDGLSDALEFFLDGDPLGAATSTTAQELVLEILTPLSQLR